MIKPIAPSEVTGLKAKIIPEGVIDAFNKMIAKHFTGRTATFKQEEIVSAVAEALAVDRATIYENKWLDVEDIYREAGWKVTYDKPAYNESYAATFTFAK